MHRVRGLPSSDDSIDGTLWSSSSPICYKPTKVGPFPVVSGSHIALVLHPLPEGGGKKTRGLGVKTAMTPVRNVIL